MITGKLQFGDKEFIDYVPAEVNVAGDPDDPNGPTYASFTNLLGAQPAAQDAPVSSRVARDGSVSDDPSLASYRVTADMFVKETNHRVASVFWQFMNSTATVYENGNYVDALLFQNPYYATGYPLTEAYWTTVRVGGTPKNVLMQVFERRVLTFTPDNPDGWKVEAGNVGQHYFRWRYGAERPSEPPAVDDTDTLSVGPTPKMHYDGELHDNVVTWQIGNQSPFPMTFTFEGPTTVTIELPPCDQCQVYPYKQLFTKCEDYIPCSVRSASACWA